MAGGYPYCQSRRKRAPDISQIPWQKIPLFTPADLVKLVVTAAIIAMVWMHQAKQSSERLANHAEGTCWFVLSTLPMFLIMPWMLRNGWDFRATLAVN